MLLRLLLLVAVASAATYFELDGHFASIPASVVPSLRENHELFLKTEKEIKEKLQVVFKNSVEEFFIKKIEIHGEDVLPTAIFTAYLATSLSRDQLIQLVAADEHLDVFRLKEIGALPPRPSPFPLNSAAVSSCQNGGFLLPNSTCVCPPFFTGDSCEIVNCLNGGIADNGRCACPPGIYAVNCEQRGCLPQVQSTLDVSQQSFILVVNQKSSMSYVINQLANRLERITEAIRESTANYILVNYLQNKNGLIMTKNVFSTADDLVNYVNTLVYTSAGNVRQPTNRAILAAQSFSPFMKGLSTVFVFADSLDSEAGNANYKLSSNSTENQLILQTLAWKNKIVYFLSSSIGTKLDDSDNGYLSFQRVATATLGDVINFFNNEIDELLMWISGYSQTGTVGALYGVSNDKNIQVYFESYSDNEIVYVLLTIPPSGTLPKLTDTDKKMQLVATGSMFQLYTTAEHEKSIEAHKGGVGWNLRAWIQSPITAFFGFQYGSGDFGTPYVISNYENLLNAVVPGDETSSVTYWWRNTTDGNVLTIDLYRDFARDDECTYTRTLGSMNQHCTPGAFGQVFKLRNNTSGVENTRILPGYCLTLDPAPRNVHKCLNGGTLSGPQSCRCTANFQGLNCQFPRCQNLGTENPFPGNGRGLCSCLPGYSGDFCEILSCPTMTNFNPPAYSPTLAVVLQSSLSQSQISPRIDAAVNKLISDMRGNDEYQHFVLTTFVGITVNDTMQWNVKTTSFTDSNLFLNVLGKIQYLPSPSSTQQPMRATLNALESWTIFRSPLFLFVDSAANDIGYENDVVAKAIANGVRLTIVITPPFGMVEMCMDTKSQQFYQGLADKTGGTLLNLCQSLKHNYQQDEIYQLFYGYGLAHHRTEMLNEIYSKSFMGFEDPSITFYVDEPENDVFFTVNCPTTETFTATVTNMDLKITTPLSAMTNMPFAAVYRIPTTSINYLGYVVTILLGSGSTNGPCIMQALEKTKTAAYVLFSPDPSYDGTSQQAVYAVPSSPVLHFSSNKVNNSIAPVLVETDDDLSFIYDEQGKLRDNSCSFEFFFPKKLTCTKPGDSFITRIFAVASNGIELYRSLRSYCYLEDGKCANGGYKLADGACKCPPDFGGALCQNPKCRNGAVPNYNFQCNCDYKHTGQFCEFAICNDWNYMEDVDPRENNMKQITFVLDRSVNNLLVNVQLANVIQNIVDATESKQVPVMYSLITFDQYGIYRIISTSHAQQFVDTFKNTINVVQTKQDFTTGKSLDALNEAYKLNIQFPGAIYLFTSLPPFQASLSTVDDHLQQKVYSQVNVFYIPPKTDYPSIPTDKNTRQLLEAAKQSGGRFLALTANSISQIDKLIIANSKEHGVVADYAAPDCSSGTMFAFNLESQFKFLELTVTGIDVNRPEQVIVSDGEGQILPMDNVIFRDNKVLVVTFNSSYAAGGTWSVYIKTTVGSCDFQARVDSDIRIIPGFTINPNDDFVHQLPFSGLGDNSSTYMTFRLVYSSDNRNDGATLLNVLIYNTNLTDYDSFSTAMTTLQLMKRDPNGCAYQFVSQEWKVDPYPQQRFVISGLDKNNVAFQRMLYYTFPTFDQRSATCLNNGKHDDYGQCICRDKTLWTGDYCQDAICQNGGTTSFGVCVCPNNGWYGDNCEIPAS